VHGGLARAVRGCKRRREQSHDAADVGDHGAAILCRRRAQQRHGLGGHRHRCNDIGLELATQILAREIDHGADLGKAGVVDQQVEVSGFARYRVERSYYGRIVVDVERQAADAFGLKRGQCLGAAGGGVDPVTAFGEFAGERGADAAGAPRDEDGFLHLHSPSERVTKSNRGTRSYESYSLASRARAGQARGAV
jgi:hypothetical protein